jgi:raffinose/stachyose/melibiose transport system permease protein
MAAAEQVPPPSSPRGRSQRGQRYDSPIAKRFRGSIALALLPALALFGTFFVVPIGVLAGTAFVEWNASGVTFTGFANFVRLAGDDAFLAALRNQAIWMAAAVFLHVPLAVFIALVLSRRMRGWKVFRTLFFLPNIVSFAALAMVFLAFYNARYGMLNEALGFVGLEGLQQDWLFNPRTALAAIIGTWIFHVGLFMIIILAGIASIPISLYEAAAVDGAKWWQRDLYVTLPLLRNVIGTCMVLTATISLIYFEGIFIMTEGGPANATLNLPMFAYRNYTLFDWGYANAIGLVILIMGMAVMLSIRRLFGLGEREG